MKRLHQTILVVTSVLAAALAPAGLQAQSFDTSGTANLNGQYLFRYVNFFNDQYGNLTESCTLSGVITFDGAGKYTLSNTHLAETASVTGLGSCASLEGGSYGVQSNGIAQLDNPLYPATLFGTFSQPVLIASSTEDDYFDLFIAVQAPSGSSSNSLLSGSYTVGTLDFLNASASLARQGYFTLSADGNGNIAAFTLTGSMQNVGFGKTLTQQVASSTYSLASAEGGTVTFPGSAGSDLDIVSGTKALYVSADGNWFVGGSIDGSDMLFGFRAPSGTSSNALLNGTYFTAGMEDAFPASLNFLDAFYGSVNANGTGVLISHQRYDDVVDIDTYDNTFNTSVTIGADGSYYDGSTYTYLAGAKGTALMLIGSDQEYSLIIGVQAPSFKPPSAVWINPVGITDAANYTPITNAFAPGELVSLYGTFGVSTQTADSFPLSTTLGGVQVLVNGQAAPVYLVSQNQISALIPYETAGQSFATFQVVVNQAKSNSVTVYLGNSAPGIYTLAQNGIGAGAILHSDYSAVSDSNPAMPGETVLMYMNGLGPVTPQVADGAAAPSSPVSTSVEAAAVSVFLTDGVNFSPADVSFAGLAPGFAGLYQVNFMVPTGGLMNGAVTINLGTIEALNAMATINLSGFSTNSGLVTPARRGFRLRRHSRRLPANLRRALPERPRETF
ncbi:MAG TPA: hypothetical protein VMB25_04885 [Bryobacteraceae bacterium]|nr:hypothetical protein [Bryobacteraceae bacterium]